jgi:hypothetical protein
MLRTIKGWFGQQHVPYDETLPEHPPKIFVTVTTSSDIMSKFGAVPFTITLHAVVESDRSVTVDVFHTILWHRCLYRYYRGLTFVDTETGELAKMEQLDEQWCIKGGLTADSDSIVEIPTEMSGQTPYQVRFNYEKRYDLNLQEGSEYKVGLGPMTSISW